MPNLLAIVMRKTNEQGLNLSFSQMKKSARRFEKRCEGWLLEDAEAYVMQHQDPTGETAVKNVQQELNEASAARRLGVAA